MKNRIIAQLIIGGLLGWFGNDYYENNYRQLHNEIVTEEGNVIELYSNNTWEHVREKDIIPLSYSSHQSVNQTIGTTDQSLLRPGITTIATKEAIAIELATQGWTYTMPRPKSEGAKWGITDGRTTWFEGYWYNKTSNSYSSELPQKGNDGIYVGDGINRKGYWDTGGTPPTPSDLEWLLSDYGGPNDQK